MKYFFCTMAAGIIFVNAGCSMQTTSHFSGEGEDWEVTYTANEETGAYDIQYTGEAPIPEMINYSIDTFSVTGRLLSENGYFENEISQNSVDESDEEINVTIEWGDEAESFNLRQE